MFWAKIITLTAEETESTNPELTQDSERSSHPLQRSTIEAACVIFTSEDSSSEHLDSERSNSEHSGLEHSDSEHSDLEQSSAEDQRSEDDIIKIIQLCLKDAKKHNTKWRIRTLTQLGAVDKYVKLCARYQKHNACKRPCLNASMAIAHQMAKGPYFACQIRRNELYLQWYHHLPPSKLYTRHGHHTLLDNEAILHGMHMYLAAQDLSTITPLAFCQQVNTVILPALEITGTISESTAQRWLRCKLGYQSKEAKKGVYIDGHEHPDVIKEWQEFGNLIFNKYEW